MNIMNNSVTAIIADDEQHLSRYLKEKLNQLWPELNIVGIANNGVEAVKLIQEKQPQIAFLDIHMPGFSGLEVAKQLIVRPHIVFVTAFDQYAIQAFEQYATDYVLKPVSDERLKCTIENLKARIQLPTPETAPTSTQDINALLLKMLELQKSTSTEKPKYLRWIRALKREVVTQIPVEDVLFLQAQDKYVVVTTRSGEALIRTPLSELITQLNPEEFWQIHRSTVVNINYVSSSYNNLMGKTLLCMKESKQELAVSRAYQHLFKQM
jgi:DNA-binding LytR/AlgR family response regulator